MRADLHIHSVYSDGLYSPKQVCEIAKKRGLDLLSITDHDTLNGEENKRAAAAEFGLAYLSGWEISAYEDGLKLHILGYGCQKNQAYEAFTQKRKEAALARAKESVEKLRSIGIAITLDDVLALQSDKSAPLHTMHIARAVGRFLKIEEGAAYETYLAPGRIACSSVGRPTPKESIDCIHAMGGVAVLAHPGRIFLSEIERERTIKRLVKQGLDGIEAVYTTHTDKETEYFVELAKKQGLLVTGGSDTHVEDGTHAIGAPSFTLAKALMERLGL